MLNKLGAFVAKNRWWVIGTWVVLAAVIIIFSPKLSSVTSSNQTSFLPHKYESVRAQKIADNKFPDAKGDAELLLIQRDDGSKLTAQDQLAVANLAQELTAAKLSHVVLVSTSRAAVSKDGTAQTIQMLIDRQPSGGQSDKTLIKAIRSQVKALLVGGHLTGKLTGQIALNADSSSAIGTATKIITIATFLLVIILPGLIFRSPVAAVAPVLAVSLVYLVVQSLIALTATAFNFKISDQLSILYTVVLFGIGTDYILFLLFRYREKLRAGSQGREAVAFALSRAGEAILSAALVVAAAFAVLGVSNFGIFKNLAPGLVICVLTMLLAVLTLIPAIIAVIGPKIFWPSRAWQRQPKGTFAKRVGTVIARFPALVAGLSIVLLVGLASGYLHFKTDYNTLSQLPQNTESTIAYNTISRKYSASAISPTQIYFVSSSAISPQQASQLRQAVLATKDISLAGLPQLSTDGSTFELNVFLPGQPYDDSTLNYIRDTFRPAMHRIGEHYGVQTYIGGQSAAFVDVRSAVSHDLAVILPIAGVIIFLILALLLRSILAPLYLLVTVALGFTATLGGTTYLFQDALGKAGLIFFIPIMVYIFVVAIGTDYNILIMTRLREEVRAGNRPRQASDLAVEHSGATIASAGIILAGTFGSLALAGLSLLAQLGFAVAFGIMLAAFIISTLLVPSLAALLGRRIWWPGERPSTDPSRPT